MIGSLTGIIAAKGARQLIVDVGGVGYSVFVSTGTLFSVEVGSSLTLYTHLSVREDALELFGFSEHSELSLFELLISVSGVGPKSALAILSLSTPEHVRRAISEGDVSALTKVSGIGKKSAEKIIIELRDKVGASTNDALASGEADVLDALRALGYSLSEARAALKNTSGTDTANRVKDALRYLNS